MKTLSGTYDRIDLFWPGMFLVEHKSLGMNLSEAERQAFRYIGNLASRRSTHEMPRYVITSDFAHISLLDLEPEEPDRKPARVAIESKFPLADLHRYIHEFAFIPGYQQHRFEDQDPATSRRRDHGRSSRHDGKPAVIAATTSNVFWCGFSFVCLPNKQASLNASAFHLYIENRTSNDGSDLGIQLARLFEVLNTPPDTRQKTLTRRWRRFLMSTVNFSSERFGFAEFNRDMRNILLACTTFDWSCISPAIFGSLFQGIMQPHDRRQIGGHYTSERDILKVIRSLFLDDLRTEFDRIKTNKSQLKQFHRRIAGLRLFDPACGCGNFLVVAYRELRLLEIDVLVAIHGTKQQHLDIQSLSLVDVDAFYGIEISEWPARIAEVAMWLMDHQMNIRLSEVFGQYFVRLPFGNPPRSFLIMLFVSTGRRSFQRNSAAISSAIRRLWARNIKMTPNGPIWTLWLVA